MNNFYAFLPVLVGFLIPIQAKLNGKLFSLNQNAIFTSLISVTLSGLIIGLVFFSTSRSFPLVKAPFWVYLGGLFGALYLVGLSWVAVKVNTTQLVAGLLAGQMLMALLIDLVQTGKVTGRQIVSCALVVVAVLLKK